jgi:hypothetical protein
MNNHRRASSSVIGFMSNLCPGITRLKISEQLCSWLFAKGFPALRLLLTTLGYLLLYVCSTGQGPINFIGPWYR